MDIGDRAWLSQYAKGEAPSYIPFTHSPVEPGILYTGTVHLYRLFAVGTAWEAVTRRDTGDLFTTAVTLDKDGKAIGRETIAAIAVSQSTPAIVYVATQDGRCFRLERGADQRYAVAPAAGLPALDPATGRLRPVEAISDIAVDPADPQHLFVSIGATHGVNGLTQITAGRIFLRVRTAAKPGSSRTTQLDWT